MGFVASVLRNIIENNKGLVPRTEFTLALNKKVEEAKERWKDDNKYELQTLRQLKEVIDIFEKASGVKIDRWDGGNIGKIVKMIQENRGHGMLRNTILSQIQHAEHAGVVFKEVIENLSRLIIEIDKSSV